MLRRWIYLFYSTSWRTIRTQLWVTITQLFGNHSTLLGNGSPTETFISLSVEILILLRGMTERYYVVPNKRIESLWESSTRVFLHRKMFVTFFSLLLDFKNENRAPAQSSLYIYVYLYSTNTSDIFFLDRIQFEIFNFRCWYTQSYVKTEHPLPSSLVARTSNLRLFQPLITFEISLEKIHINVFVILSKYKQNSKWRDNVISSAQIW